jgi:hypothetical protein
MTVVATNQSSEIQAQSSQEIPAGVSPHSATCSEVRLRLLSLLEQNPTWTQRQLAHALGGESWQDQLLLRALKDMDFVKWGNFSQNLNKLYYMGLLTPRASLRGHKLTAHFLQRKEREFEELRSEIMRLRAKLGDSNSGTIIATPPRCEPLRCERALRWICRMRSLTNGSQRIVVTVRGDSSGDRGTVISLAELGAAAMSQGSWGARAGTRYRALAGKCKISFENQFLLKADHRHHQLFT